MLVAALLVDLLIISAVGFDGIGPNGSELWLLPGIAGLTACALVAPTRPARSAWAGSAVLVASSGLIAGADAASYTALLHQITFSETVAGLALLYHCVRALTVLDALFAASALVVSTLIAVATRAGFVFGVPANQTVFTGMALLVITVVAGMMGRGPTTTRRSPVGTLLRGQWPVVGLLAGALFLELMYLSSAAPDAAVVLVLSLAGAVGALTAVRDPARAVLVFTAVVLATTVLVRMFGGHGFYPTTGGLPFGQVASGVVVVVVLVRQSPPRRAGALIGVMSAVVAVAAVVNGTAGYTEALRPLFVGALLLLGIAVAFGMFLRARDSERTRMVATAVSDAQTAERMALARELHDVVAHHVTGIVVQAQAMRAVAEQDPRVVVDALGQIERAGTEAMTAMRRLVRSMRGEAPAGAGEFSEQATTDLAADLHRLVETGNHGVPTEIDLDLPPDLPPEVARSALRLVQESLTNVGKHAEGVTRAVVAAHARGGELSLEVRDDGTGQRARPEEDSGYGLIGMRERVELLRGRLSAGPSAEGGWAVRAWLPIEGDTDRRDGQ